MGWVSLISMAGFVKLPTPFRSLDEQMHQEMMGRLGRQLLSGSWVGGG